MKFLLKFALNLFLAYLSGNGRFKQAVWLQNFFFLITTLYYLGSLSKRKNTFQSTKAGEYRVCLISSSVFNRMQITGRRIIGGKGRKLGWG